MFERILVPLDGSRLSTKALPYASEIAKKFDAELVLLQVLEPTRPVVLADTDGFGSAGVASGVPNINREVMFSIGQIR